MHLCYSHVREISLLLMCTQCNFVTHVYAKHLSYSCLEHTVCAERFVITHGNAMMSCCEDCGGDVMQCMTVVMMSYCDGYGVGCHTLA